VYSALSVEQSSDYSLVKKEILRAYKLVPEAYRQRFRDAKCTENRPTWNLQERKRRYLISGVLPNKLEAITAYFT